MNVPSTCEYYSACEWCLDPCADAVSCCANGSCIGDSFGEGELGIRISAAMCIYIYGGIPAYGYQDFTVEACCINGECENITRIECRQRGGTSLNGRNCNHDLEEPC